MSDIIEDPRKVISNALVELGAKNSNVLYISCDSSLGASGGEFNKRFPARFRIIAVENMQHITIYYFYNV